jgi:hypothetical protein
MQIAKNALGKHVYPVSIHHYNLVPFNNLGNALNNIPPTLCTKTMFGDIQFSLLKTFKKKIL